MQHTAPAVCTQSYRPHSTGCSPTQYGFSLLMVKLESSSHQCWLPAPGKLVNLTSGNSGDQPAFALGTFRAVPSQLFSACLSICSLQLIR